MVNGYYRHTNSIGFFTWLLKLFGCHRVKLKVK